MQFSTKRPRFFKTTDNIFNLPAVPTFEGPASKQISQLILMQICSTKCIRNVPTVNKWTFVQVMTLYETVAIHHPNE